MLDLLGLGKIKLLLIGAAVALLVGMYVWNQSLRSDLRISEANSAQLRTAVETQRGAVEAAVKNARRWQTALQDLTGRIEELTRVQREASSESRRLRKIFSRHDLAALALAKPGLIERRIGAGSLDAFRVLNRITSEDLHKTRGAGKTTNPSTNP